MPKKTCFVVSPIGADDTAVRLAADDFLELLVEPALQPFGFEILRADKIAAPTVITADIIQLVQTADLCVIDLTDLNPNVFYECGRRHETGKPFIQLIKKDQDLPFDVAGIRTILYDLSDPRSTLESVREIQRFVSQIAQDNYSEAASGQSLATISETLRRLERKLNELAAVKPASAESPVGTRDLLTQHPVTAFNNAIDQGDIAAAVQLLPRIRALTGDSNAIRAAVICAQAGETAGESLLRKILADSDDLSLDDVLQCTFGIKEYYFNRNMNKEGIEVLEQISKERPTSQSESEEASLLNMLQMLYYADGQYEEAERLLKKCVKLAPAEPVYLVNLGLTYKSWGQLEEAVEAIDEALRIDPSYVGALELAEKLYPQVGREDEAERARQRIAESH